MFNFAVTFLEFTSRKHPDKDTIHAPAAAL